jgi:hypothetical protein
MANARAESRRTLARIERVRRGWVFRDVDGRGWWVDDTVVVNSTYRIVPAGHPSATCRIFTPMVGARDGTRRVYGFQADESHAVSVAAVTRQLRAASCDLTPSGRV